MLVWQFNLNSGIIILLAFFYAFNWSKCLCQWSNPECTKQWTTKSLFLHVQSFSLELQVNFHCSRSSWKKKKKKKQFLPKWGYNVKYWRNVKRDVLGSIRVSCNTVRFAKTKCSNCNSWVFRRHGNIVTLLFIFQITILPLKRVYVLE